MYVYEDTNGAQVSASGTTKEDYRSTTINVSTSTSLSGVLVDPTESSKSDITVNFYFVGEDGEGNYKIPDYADGFLGGYYTDGVYNNDAEVHGTWTSPDETDTILTEITSGDTTYYSITLDSLYNGDVTFQIYLEYKDEETGEFSDWTHQMWDIDYTVSKYLADGSSIDVAVNQDPNDFFEDEGDEPGNEPGGETSTTEFYVFAFDYSNDSYYTNCMSSVEASVACFGGNATATGTDAIGIDTLTDSGTYYQAYIYTKAVATYTAGSIVSITFSGQDGNNTITIKTGNITIPEVEAGNIAIYFCAYESEGNFWSDNGTPGYSAEAWAAVWGGTPSNYKPDSNGWVTNCSSLSAFISDLNTISSMVH